MKIVSERAEPEEIDDEMMERIATRAAKLMKERYGIVINQWLINNNHYVESLAKFTWQAMREEMER